MVTSSPSPRPAASILDDLCAAVGESLRQSAAPVTIADVRVGVFYAGVKLSTGHGGIAYCSSEELPLDHGKRHSYMPRAGRLSSLSVEGAASLAFSENILESAVGLATINALAELGYSRGLPAGTRNVPDIDAIEVLKVRSDETVTMVGAFPFFIRQLRGKVANLYVTERNPEAYTGYPLVPADEQESALAAADVVLVTAATLANHTLDTILPLCRRARDVAIVGPTTPLCPEPLFRHGVTLVGGTHLTDADMVLRVVGEAGTGGHLWAGSAQKVNLVRSCCS